MYKCAIIGVSGGRAHGHAQAYRHIKRGQLVAISSRETDKLNIFGDQYAIADRYTDYQEMFARAQPDLVHVNTPPNVRLEIMAAAAAANIPALIIEKPLALQTEDYEAIQNFARHSQTKISINHQLHFHPRRQMLQKLVQENGIGEIRFIDASARMNMAYQGTHTLQAMGAFNLEAVPIQIMGQVGGRQGLRETPRWHLAPDYCMATLIYDNGVSGLLRCGTNAPFVLANDERINVHKRIAVYGTKGYVHWTMWSWEVGQDGRVESGSHHYPDEDILGQAAMTEAMFDWLTDEHLVHPLNLATALQDFRIVLNVYTSALARQVVTLTDKPQYNLIHDLLGQI